jgi:hypothetical protein
VSANFSIAHTIALTMSHPQQPEGDLRDGRDILPPKNAIANEIQNATQTHHFI